MSNKQGADGQTKQTYWAAYTSWRNGFGRDYWPYLVRASRVWNKIKTWLAANMPDILATLRPGLSEAEVCAVESELGFALPPALKVLYRLHDGQSLARDDELEQEIRRRYRAVAAAAPRGPVPSRGAAAGGTAVAAAGDAGNDQEGDEEEETATPATDDETLLASVFRGLFGGYGVYEHRVVSRMLPLRRAVLWRNEMLRVAAATRERSLAVMAERARTHGMPEPEEQAAAWWATECKRREDAAWQAGLEARGNLDYLLPFSSSFDMADKMMVADAISGALAAVTKLRPGGWDLRPAVPSAASRDGPLRWFEEYARRLESGYYQPWFMDEQNPTVTRIISLFPRTPPALMEAVTRGVRVCASVVYVSEASMQGRNLFAYAIRFSMDPGAPLARCQLTHRHWVIRDEHGRELDKVHGEGVIGLYPILEPGKPEFVYCSCTHQAATHGSMDGEFEFVPGTIERPEGPPFTVVCPTFRLDIPDFIF